MGKKKQKFKVTYEHLGIVIFVIALLGLPFLSGKEPKRDDRAGDTPYELCFTPQQKCLPLIEDKMRGAHKSILLQSYSFTSKPIADALIQAHKKGIRVVVIADKGQATDKHSQVKRLAQEGILVYIDYKPAIAHNKIMILDEDAILTGSYNWTKAAEERNAENLLFLSNPELAKRYSENFTTRLKNAKPLPQYLLSKGSHGKPLKG